jgi:DNA end-binding protein Ku
MPPIWSGSLTFSLVSIPVTVQSATSSHRVVFRQVHTEDLGRVRNIKVCELDEDKHPLTADEIGRAYEAGGGVLVEIGDDELDGMPLPTLRTIEVDGFVDLASVPPEQIDKPYFLAPASPAANKPYALMRGALARSGKAAIGKLAMRGSERLAAVYARGDVLVLQMLHWPDELREAADAAPGADVELSDEELAGAAALIDSMSGISMEDFHDDYSEAVRKLIEAKAAGAEPQPAPAKAEGGGDTVDLMAALEASLTRARSGRSDDHGGGGGGGGAGSAEVTHLHEKRASKAAAKKGAAKQTAAKKQPAKKGAAKKATAKKQPAKKAAPRGKRAG